VDDLVLLRFGRIYIHRNCLRDEVEGEARVTSKKKLKENRHKTANSNGQGTKRARKDDEADEARTETVKKRKSQL